MEFKPLSTLSMYHISSAPRLPAHRSSSFLYSYTAQSPDPLEIGLYLELYENLSWRITQIRLACGCVCVGIFFIALKSEGSTSCGRYHPWAGDWLFKRWVVGQANKQVSSKVSASSLCLSSFPWFPFMMDCNLGTQDEINPFFFKWLLVVVCVSQQQKAS